MYILSKITKCTQFLNNVKKQKKGIITKAKGESFLKIKEKKFFRFVLLFILSCSSFPPNRPVN